MTGDPRALHGVGGLLRSVPAYSGSRAAKRETEAHPTDLHPPPTYLQLLVVPPKMYQPVWLQVPVSSVTAVAF